MSRLTILLLGCLGLVFVAAPGLPASAPAATPTPTPAPVRATPSPIPTSSPIPPAATATPASVASPTPMPALPRLTPTPTATALEPLDQPELRGVWVDAFHDGFKTPQQVDDLVAWARDANLNALFVQVRRRGDAYYLKSFEPRTDDPNLAPGFDALQYLIDRAHQGPRPLQVHAWLATLPIWGEREAAPLASNHPFNLRGASAGPTDTWLMYRDDGATWAGTGTSGMYYLDPGNIEVQSYTTEVYLSLLRNYDVDGIHLDQIRYFEGDALRWGYNPSSVARFNARFGLDPSSQPAPTDPNWVAWRRDQVTELVRHIYVGAKALKPNVAVTAAVIAWGKGPQTPDDWERQPAFASVLQDWWKWLDDGIVDYVLPMNYYREAGEQSAWFDTWTQWQVSHAGKRGVVLGMGSYLNSADGALAQLGRARALGALGVALYSYAVPTADLADATRDDREAFAAQLRSVFARPAPVPSLPPPPTASRP